MRRLAWILLTLVWASAATARPVLEPDSTSERTLEASVVSYAQEHFGLALRTDPALRASARELSLVCAAGHEVQAHEFLRQAESHNGVLDPFPYVFYGSAPAGSEVEILERLYEHLQQLPGREQRLYTHVAAGVVVRSQRRLWFRKERTVFVSLLLSQRSLSFASLPTVLEPGQRFPFEGEVYAPFRKPLILLTRPDGEVQTLEDLSLDAGSFRTWVSLDAGEGEYQLEVLARDDMGPRVLGLCSLYARPAGHPTPHEVLLAAVRDGTLESPSQPFPKRLPVATPEEAEERMFELVNRDRRHAGLPALTFDPQLASMARAHSRDMMQHDFFAHVSPQTGRLSERAELAGVRYVRLGENIAVHRDVESAEAALLRSPGHRVNILDGQFTHVGIGVVLGTDADGGPRMYITQNFSVPAP